MVLAGVLIVLFVLLICLLLVPIVLFIDTATNQYYFQVQGLAKASIESHDKEFLCIKLNTFFRNFYFYPLKKSTQKKTKRIGEKKAKKKKRSVVNAKQGIRLLKSFKVKKFLMDIDTGDCVLNAKLYPAFAFLNFYVGNFNINFEGRNRMVLHMVNRPINLIRSFINV